MAITITLPDVLAAKLETEAQAQRRSLEDLVVSLLNDAVAEETFPTPEEVVARIKATPPNPNNIRPATGSLAEYLSRLVPEDPDFNVAEWERQWDAIEAEMKAITRANDIAEGRL
jgi:plasmid stability protein